MILNIESTETLQKARHVPEICLSETCAAYNTDLSSRYLQIMNASSQEGMNILVVLALY